MVQRPVGFNAFEFAVVAGLRAAQLARGCTPRVDGSAKVAVTAQMEVAARKIVREPDAPAPDAARAGALDAAHVGALDGAQARD